MGCWLLPCCSTDVGRLVGTQRRKKGLPLRAHLSWASGENSCLSTSVCQHRDGSLVLFCVFRETCCRKSLQVGICLYKPVSSRERRRPEGVEEKAMSKRLGKGRIKNRDEFALLLLALTTVAVGFGEWRLPGELSDVVQLGPSSLSCRDLGSQLHPGGSMRVRGAPPHPCGWEITLAAISQRPGGGSSWGLPTHLCLHVHLEWGVEIKVFQQ